MSITVEATYENGVLRLTQPLPLREQEKVQITVHTRHSVEESPRGVGVADQTYGIIGWKGDHETLERILAEAEEFP